MPRTDRRPTPMATKRSDDLRLWAAENESIGHALSMTLRHDAFVMRLECLPMKVDSSEARMVDTTWFAIADLLAHARFKCHDYTSEHIQREVDMNVKTHYITHEDGTYISAWN